MTGLSTLSRRWKPAAKRFLGTVGLVTLLMTSGVVLIRRVGLLQDAELNAYDTLMQQRPVADVDERVLVVGISEEDIQTRGEYPISDKTLAAVLSKLVENEPRVIGLDIARDVPIGEGRAALIQALSNNPEIIGACTLSSEGNPGLPPPPGVSEDRIAFADLPLDAKGVVRRGILVSTPAPANMPLPSEHLCNTVNPDNQILSLGLAVAATYLSYENIELGATEDNTLLFGDVPIPRLGNSVVGYQGLNPQDYQVLINYRADTEPVHVVSLSDVLANRVNPEWIRDRMILIGYTSDIAKDVFATPLNGRQENSTLMPGVVIHAQIASQLVSTAMGDRPSIWYWSGLGEAGWILLWALIGGTLAYTSRRIWLFVILEGGAIALLYFACRLLFAQYGWVPLIPPMITVVTTAVGVVLLDRADKEGYTQAVYEQVRDQMRGALKPKIEIDEVKRAQQVSEITETGYFKDLAARAKEIRERRMREAESPNNNDAP